MNNERSQFTVLNYTVNNKKCYNIVNNNFAHEPDGLLFVVTFKLISKTTAIYYFDKVLGSTMNGDMR